MIASMNNVELGIEFPQADVDKLFAQIARAQSELGKGLRASITWAGKMLMSSLSAGTRKSPKLRKIVENPLFKERPETKKDRRRARYGVMAYKKGQEVFKPIYRTGEFGRIRFVDKKTAEVKYISSLTGKVHRAETFAQEGPLSIKNDKRRIIGRSGLAKKSWSIAGTLLHRGGRVTAFGVARASEVHWTGGDNNPTIVIWNNLKYIDKAIIGGLAGINGAFERAANNMEHKIGRAIDDKLKVSA